LAKTFFELIEGQGIINLQKVMRKKSVFTVIVNCPCHHFDVCPKVIHPKYYKHLKKGVHQSHLGRQKMGWFLAD
jgi:hypothetical protein